MLPSKIQARTFELLGADPKIMDLTEAIALITKDGIDAQENPLTNTVTYGVHKFHRFHTISNHFYISRPIFLHRPTFESWPADLQAAMQRAIDASVAFQRDLHVKEEDESEQAIRAQGCEIVELDARPAQGVRRGGAADLPGGAANPRRRAVQARSEPVDGTHAASHLPGRLDRS